MVQGAPGVFRQSGVPLGKYHVQMVQGVPGVSRCSTRQYLVQMVQGAPGVSGSRCSVRQGSRSKLQAVQGSSSGLHTVQGAPGVVFTKVQWLLLDFCLTFPNPW